MTFWHNYRALTRALTWRKNRFWNCQWQPCCFQMEAICLLAHPHSPTCTMQFFFYLLYFFFFFALNEMKNVMGTGGENKYTCKEKFFLKFVPADEHSSWEILHVSKMNEMKWDIYSYGTDLFWRNVMVWQIMIMMIVGKKKKEWKEKRRE